MRVTPTHFGTRDRSDQRSLPSILFSGCERETIVKGGVSRRADQNRTGKSPIVPFPGSKEPPPQAQAPRDVLAMVGLPQLGPRLEEEAHWNRMLSLGEQQRLGLARALLHRPDYLFLDEATASLDEPSEAALYRLLEEKLPQTTIVSIGHRSTLEAFHQRHVVMVRDGDRFTVQNAVGAEV